MSTLRRLTFPLCAIGETLFPVTCWVDSTSVDAPGGLSPGVRLEIAQLAAQPYCGRCGLTTGPFASNDRANPCGRCDERQVGVRRIARVGTFSEPLITLVHRLKFGRSWELAGILAPFVYQAMVAASESSALPVDVMVPVPLHWRRRMRRGFNQAEELAREVRALSQWPVRTPLRRRRATAAQARIGGRTRRAENLQNAFVCRADAELAGKHIWLVDDVTTTGATLHAAATAMRRLPRECRPASINAAVLCVTDPGSPPPVVEAC